MQIETKTPARKNLRATAVALALLLIGGRAPLHGQSTTANAEKKALMASKFYCNIKALNPTERAQHKELTANLIAARGEIVEAARATNSSIARRRFHSLNWPIGWWPRASAVPSLIFTLTWSEGESCCACA
jgi:hypothetical protein